MNPQGDSEYLNSEARNLVAALAEYGRALLAGGDGTATGTAMLAEASAANRRLAARR